MLWFPYIIILCIFWFLVLWKHTSSSQRKAGTLLSRSLRPTCLKLQRYYYNYIFVCLNYTFSKVWIHLFFSLSNWKDSEAEACGKKIFHFFAWYELHLLQMYSLSCHSSALCHAPLPVNVSQFRRELGWVVILSVQCMISVCGICTLRPFSLLTI